MLLLIDVFVITAFSVGGMKFHAVPGSWWGEFWRISLPFLVGYLASGWAAEAYDSCESGREFARRSGLGLAVGLLCSLFLRGMQTGQWPTLPFVVASSIFFGVTASTLRALYWRIKLSGQIE